MFGRGTEVFAAYRSLMSGMENADERLRAAEPPS